MIAPPIAPPIAPIGPEPPWPIPRIEEEYDRLLEADPTAAHDARAQLEALMIERGIRSGDQLFPTLLKPDFTAGALHREGVAAAEGIDRAVGELGRLLLEHDELFHLLGLSSEMRELLAIDPGYDRFVAASRPDFTWSGGRAVAYEVNADLPWMSFPDVIQELQRNLFPLRSLSERYELVYFDRTKQMLDSALAIHRDWGGTGSPTLALVSWEPSTEIEREAVARRLEELGCAAFTCHPSELSIEAGRLTARGRRIDLVHRRVLFPDFLRRADELKILLTAYRERLACFVNPLRSFLVGNKLLLALLCEERVLARLTPASRQAAERHLVPTRIVTAELRRELSARKEAWVLKGAFSYGGKEVVIGAAVSQPEWDRALEDTQRGRWVVQPFLEPTSFRAPRFDSAGTIGWETLHANWNPLVLSGRFAGAFARVSASIMISMTSRGAAVLPSIACP